MYLFTYIFFFFFKQKTAYEMRISDWSSDVCSSDLRARWRAHSYSRENNTDRRSSRSNGCCGQSGVPERKSRNFLHANCGRPAAPCHQDQRYWSSTHRSEEHTSELQSLMRISYAVFCLKKKNYTIT